MPILQNYGDNNVDASVELIESEQDKQARLARLRAAEIKRKLKHIDTQRIRPLAAIVAGTATDVDRRKLAELEIKATALRTELAEVQTNG